MTTLAAFLTSLVLALALTPLVRMMARRAGHIAAPRGDRWHRRPTALLGGAAIYIAFLVAVGVLVAFGHLGPQETTALPERAWIGIVLAATLMFATGMLDDLIGLNPASKLVLQGVGAAIIVSFGVMYPLTPWIPVNVLATMFWFIALTNALNLLDNMDGVASGIAGIAALSLAATFGWEGEWFLAGVCAALAGATFGFLPYNWHPSSIFMGDSGSLFMGALLAGLGAAYPATASHSLLPVLFVPAVIVAIPILDTALVTLTRTLAGRRLSVGGRDHTTHRLVAMGLSERQAALLLYALAAVGGGVALIAWRSDAAFGLLSIGLFGVLLIILGGYLARLHTYAPDEGPAPGRATVLVSDLLYKRRALEVVLDLVLFAAAYYAAYLLRWDGDIPRTQHLIMQETLGIAVAAQSVAFGLLGVYRGVWQQMTIVDAHRIVKSTALGTVISIVAVVFFYRDAAFARGVFVVQALLVVLLAVAVRSSVRSLDRVRVSLRPHAARTLIYGAGKAGELLLRELLGNPQLALHPIAFMDDDGKKRGRLVHGLPVYAGFEECRRVVREQRVESIVIATKKIETERRERLTALCSELQIDLLELELTIQQVQTGAGEEEPTEHTGDNSNLAEVSAKLTESSV